MKKGQMNITFVVIVCALLFLFVIGLFALPIIGSYVQSVGLFVGSTVQQLPPDGSEYNVTGKLQDVSSPITSSFRFIEWISYLFIIGFIICIFVVAAMARSYPIVAIPYVIIIGVLAICSMFISSAYIDIASKDAVISSWSMTDFILTNLPAFVIVIGLLGGVAMFILITTRDVAQ